MAAPATTEDFVDLVRRSQQVEPARLDAFLAARRSGEGLPRQPRQLAALLVREGLLTNFQAEQLLQGKYRGFVLGGYRILERLGAGGTGAVYLAEHQVMRRRVALKVLPPGYAASPGVLERFQREAQAVAALDHPNIVRAYDFRQEGGLHFFVMEYVEGVSLQELLLRQGPLPVGQAADYARQAALGLQHAHEAGLVHRDVKPANLLVDRAGTVKLLDLGLARYAPQGQESLTKQFDENAVMGTADYLAPEQALNLHGVDGRADVYSLGATLYALLAGEPPFHAGTVTQKLLWHQMREPRPLRSLRQDVPEGLDAVVARMMAKGPAERYSTPLEVADALAPWAQGTYPPQLEPDLGGKPAPAGSSSPYVRGTIAQPGAVRTAPSSKLGQPKVPATLNDTHISEGKDPRKQIELPQPRRTPPGRGKRPVARSGAGMAVAICCALALLVALLGTAGLVFFLWRASDKGSASAESAPESDRRRAKRFKLPDAVGEMFRLEHPAGVERVAFAPNGRFVLSGGIDKTVRLWDLKDRSQRPALLGHQGVVTFVGFSPDSKQGISSSADNTVRIWDLDTGVEVARFGHEKRAWVALFSPDGKQVLSGSEDNTMRLWDVSSRREVRRFVAPHTVNSLAIAPSGKRTLTACWDGSVRLWDLQDTTPMHVFEAHANHATTVAYHPDGRHALSGGEDSAVRFWDTETRKLLHTFREHTAAVWIVAISPDGKRGLSGGRDGTIRLWDLENRRLVRALTGHQDAVTGLSFAPDGRHFVSCGFDKTVRVWGLPALDRGAR